MKSDGVLKHFLFAFLLAAVIYAALYLGIEHRRMRRGPWQINFTSSNGVPLLVINQPKLALTNAQILFLNEPMPTNSLGPTDFREPRLVPYDVPFGRCVFMDATFLPGTVTFQLFGHEIELLPRVLIVDHEEHPWVSGSTLTLSK